MRSFVNDSTPDTRAVPVERHVAVHVTTAHGFEFRQVSYDSVSGSNEPVWLQAVPFYLNRNTSEYIFLMSKRELKWSTHGHPCVSFGTRGYLGVLVGT